MCFCSELRYCSVRMQYPNLKLSNLPLVILEVGSVRHEVPVSSIAPKNADRIKTLDRPSSVCLGLGITHGQPEPVGNPRIWGTHR